MCSHLPEAIRRGECFNASICSSFFRRRSQRVSCCSNRAWRTEASCPTVRASLVFGTRTLTLQAAWKPGQEASSISPRACSLEDLLARLSSSQGVLLSPMLLREECRSAEMRETRQIHVVVTHCKQSYAPYGAVPASYVHVVALPSRACELRLQKCVAAVGLDTRRGGRTRLSHLSSKSGASVL